MRHPDSILPLMIALAIAVVLHAALLPVGATMLDRSPAAPDTATLQIVFDERPESAVVEVPFRVSIGITNAGPSDTRNLRWSFYWSDDRRLDPGDVLSHEASPGGSTGELGRHELASGQTATRGFSMRPTEDLEGPRFILAVASAENADPVVASAAIWVESKHPAQITIENIDAPVSAYAGGTLPIAYTLGNSAFAGWAKAGWADRVILSPDDQLSGDDLVLLNVPRRRPLAPGATSAAGPFELRLPLGVEPGEYHLILQSVAASRNVPGHLDPRGPQFGLITVPGWDVQRAAPLRIKPATHPDLAPRDVKLTSGEGQLTVGQPTALRFDVVNRSPLATSDLLWGDRVYWSVDDQVSLDDDLLVSEPRGAYPGELPGGGRYRSGPHEIVITPEMVRSPTMYLIVVADDENDVDEGDYEANNALAVPIRIQQPVEAEQPNELKLGRDDAEPLVTVAWIAHDDFQELLARESVTLQPILQDKADPTPNAPLERDPDADSEQRVQPATAATPPTPPSPNTADAQTLPAQQTANTQRDPIDTDLPGDLPTAPEADVDQPGTADRDTPGVPSPTPTPPQSPPEPPDSPPTVASQEQGDKPTSAPRSDREADPTNLINARSVRPGQVLVGPGLEVKTFRPNWSAAARLTLPRNPQAIITFDLDGTVLQADLATTTGYDNVDGPLLSSLYRWKATGNRLKQFTAPFQIEITILINGNEPAEE